ncbi:MAG: phosphatase PAP2-related protein [Terriglobales bacterium]
MSPPHETRPAVPPARTLAIRVAITAAALTAWFWTQSLIGAKTLPASGLGDGLHALLAPLNESLHAHPQFADGLLIVSSAFIDLFGLFLLGAWIFGKSVRPFLGLVLLLGLRQIFQALVALPPPPGMIWHYPGFPSLLVTYGVANDFFFSGHTAVAVLGAVELGRLGRPWLRIAGVALAVFEVAVVLALRAHYTMDVFTGAVAALYMAQVAERISPAFDRALARILPNRLSS